MHFKVIISNIFLFNVIDRIVETFYHLFFQKLPLVSILAYNKVICSSATQTQVSLIEFEHVRILEKRVKFPL